MTSEKSKKFYYNNYQLLVLFFYVPANKNYKI